MKNLQFSFKYLTFIFLILLSACTPKNEPIRELNSLEIVFARSVSIFELDNSIGDLESQLRDLCLEREDLIAQDIQADTNYKYSLFSLLTQPDYLCGGGVCPCAEGIERNSNGGGSFYFITPSRGTVSLSSLEEVEPPTNTFTPLFVNASVVAGEQEKDLTRASVTLNDVKYDRYQLRISSFKSLLDTPGVLLRLYFKDPMDGNIKSFDFEIAIEKSDAHNGMEINYLKMNS